MAEHAIQPNSAEYAHLFPPSTLTPVPQHSTAGVDYVIVFKFPVKGKERDRLESNAQNQLDILADKITRVGLKYQVQPGKANGTLLVLVACPPATLQAQLKRERIRDFLLGVRVNDSNEEDEGDMFMSDIKDLTEAERLRIVYELLTDPESEGGAGIAPEVDAFVDSIMPLQNDDFNKEWIKTWSKKSYINDQDLTRIRDQFGEKIAFYFAFVQYYLVWLSAPTIIGVLITLFHARTLSIWYSLAMLVWSVLFIEMWKRREQSLALRWDVRNCSKHERRRLEFQGDRMVRDPVTGEEEPYSPAWKIFVRRAMSIPGVALGAFLLSIIVAFVFVAQLFLHEYYTGPFHQVLHYAPTIGYVLFIPTMSGIYSSWVKILNNWEMHKTESSWEYNYTRKIFVANFLVAYLSLFFIGWIYIPFGDHVLPYLSDLNISHSHTKVDFQRLRAQLVYFIVTGQIIGFATEMLLPYAMNLVMPKVKKMTHKDESAAAANDDNEIQAKFMKKVYKEVDLPEYNIYTDYVEMVIQFGYVSMFSTVWPLTSLCCMINNWVELRGDAVKICKYTRRPVPLRSEGVGPWIGNMETLTWLSSITMASFAYLFHPSTDIHSPYTPIFTILAILLSEHLYVLIRLGVRSALNAVPSWSDIMIRKGELRMKKVWLQRLMAGQDQKSIDPSDNNLQFDKHNVSANVIWSAKENDAHQVIQNAFKVQ
ncbi:calcium-activated chloride channel-domain-containing protein [Fennellomyces sp. T-0311]|nr:calcium-activated chloride channel-domain-containing protein [Fennellomyces sp. T-0311]